MNVTTLLSNVSKKFAAKTAVIEMGEEISYGNLWNRIERLSAAFYKIGIRDNRRVALILPNGIDFICCFFALIKINAVVSPLSLDLTSFELKNILSNLNPYAIILPSAFFDKISYDVPFLLGDKVLILQDGTPVAKQAKKFYKLKELYSERYIVGNTQANTEHIATINYTYRGLGYPLGVMLSHGNYVAGALSYVEATKMSSQHRVLSFLPFSHVFSLVGCMLAPLFCGATVVLLSNYMPRSILNIIDYCKINYFTGVPSVYKLLLQNYDDDLYDLNSLTVCITGGTFMPWEMQNEVKTKLNVEVLQGYGLTEGLAVTANSYKNNKAGTLGMPIRHDFQFKIMEDYGLHKGINEIGEIVISGPTIMQGYYKREDITYEFLRNGWLYTGDYGYIDREGYLHFVGLKKTVAKVAGNMVDLKEVENVLLSHPLISDASIYTQEDELWGHIVMAEVVLGKNAKLPNMEIRRYCAKYLSRYKVPKMIKFAKEAVNK